MSKFTELQKLRDEINIEVEGVERYPTDAPSIVIANHSCLMDIFYLAMALPEEIISVLSSRVLYKKIEKRQELIDKYLYGFPFDTSGMRSYSDISLKASVDFLKEGITIGAFPEGLLNGSKMVSRGRTGMARILFQARELGIKPYLVPVAIDVNTTDTNLDRYIPNTEDQIHVRILPPVDYEAPFMEFCNCDNYQQRNNLLHSVIDNGMETIASSLGFPYVNSYLPLVPKDNIMYADGSVLPIDVAALPENIKCYKDGIDNRACELIRSLKKK